MLTYVEDYCRGLNTELYSPLEDLSALTLEDLSARLRRVKFYRIGRKGFFEISFTQSNGIGTGFLLVLTVYAKPSTS